MRLRSDDGMTSHPDANDEWQPISRPAVNAVAAVSAWLVWQQFFTAGQWVFLLDHANLALHEAGHPAVGMVSGHFSVYGGTLFQLLFPALFARHFWRQRHAVGWAVSWVWLGESLMNVGRYMKDARAQLLPLVGGGDHDWTEIFSRWGVLARDVGIGNATRLLGLCVVLGAVAWLWRLRQRTP